MGREKVLQRILVLTSFVTFAIFLLIMYKPQNSAVNGFRDCVQWDPASLSLLYKASSLEEVHWLNNRL